MEEINNKTSSYKFDLKPENHIPSGNKTVDIGRAFHRTLFMNERYKKELDQRFNPVTPVQKCCPICNIN